MTPGVTTDSSLRRQGHQWFARRHDKRVRVTRVQILIAGALATAMAVMAVVVWLNSADWKKLLLFGGIVAVAAIMGHGREPRVAALRSREIPLDGELANYRKTRSLDAARF